MVACKFVMNWSNNRCYKGVFAINVWRVSKLRTSFCGTVGLFAEQSIFRLFFLLSNSIIGDLKLYYNKNYFSFKLFISNLLHRNSNEKLTILRFATYRILGFLLCKTTFLVGILWCDKFRDCFVFLSTSCKLWMNKETKTILPKFHKTNYVGGTETKSNIQMIWEVVYSPTFRFDAMP